MGARLRAFVSPWRKLRCLLCFVEWVRKAHAAQFCEPAERYPTSVTLSRIIFLSVPIALNRG
jgi:hypothetical protein